MSKQHLKYIFISLTVLGVVVPYSVFIPFVVEHGLDLPLLVKQAGVNRIATFAWLDVLISAVALLLASFSGSYIRLKHAYIVALLTLFAGVSAGLPLFLYFILVYTNEEGR